MLSTPEPNNDSNWLNPETVLLAPWTRKRLATDSISSEVQQEVQGLHHEYRSAKKDLKALKEVEKLQEEALEMLDGVICKINTRINSFEK
jgi:hypothetical protein